MSDPVALACPRDLEPLQRSDAAWVCEHCHGSFPIEKGVVRFLPSADEFYEGRYLNTVRFVPRRERAPWTWPLWLVTSGYVWAVRRHLPAGSTVIEMGCASGVAYFAHHYRVVGLDLSFASLARVAGLYDLCVQADAARAIPLPDASADAVISSFVWEHIPPDQKPKVLAECARVLRPGGRLVFLYDVECDNPLYRRMKALSPDLYREILIEREGHWGWQTPRENREIFENHGFDVREYSGKEKLFVAPAMYDKVQNWGGGLARLSRLGLRFRSGWAFQAYNAGLRIFDETLGRALPESWARVAIGVFEKRETGASG